MLTPKLQHSLKTLLRGLDFQLAGRVLVAIDEIEIAGVTSDSRKTGSGTLFVALRGVQFDGHDFIKAAIAGGSKAVLCEAASFVAEDFAGTDCLFVLVADSAHAYAEIAANYYGRPAEKLQCIGVTGTNGKTTVTYLVEHVLLSLGRSVGVVGTVNNRYTGKDGVLTVLPTQLTTPEAFTLQNVLWQMVESGVEYLVMEVSSHALKQARVGTMRFAAAAFTNLTRDHLDYHPDMDDYFASKARLFTEYLLETGTAVLPQCSAAGIVDWAGKLQTEVRARGIQSISWGNSADNDLQLTNFQQDLGGLSASVFFREERLQLLSPLTGRFNIENLLTAAGLCIALGCAAQDVCKALASAKGAPGRLERVDVTDVWAADNPTVFVDYAHTPDALEKVASTLAELPHRDLFCVFGCGGDRDPGKRPVMAAIAECFSDVAILTDDNPRTEDPQTIVAGVVAGFADKSLIYDHAWLNTRQPGEKGIVVIQPRDKAIHHAVASAGPGDVVLIAGKGHEPYQITTAGKRFFDDRLEAAKQMFCWRQNLVVQATGGITTSAPDATTPLGDVITDSRVQCDKAIFVALRGENHDAHDFVNQAVANGSTCLVVERQVEITLPSEKVVQIVVPDTLKALGDLAAFRLRAITSRYQQPVIGLTGSCGKTTVKEMTAAILEKVWPAGEFNPTECILKTRGNFNNLIGLPLSLLPLQPTHRAVLLEMGMNQPGELTRLGSIADPDVSCILNVHGAHLAGLETLEGVAKAKEELFKITGKESVLIINLDNPLVAEMRGRYSQKKFAYSCKPPAGAHQPDLWADNVVQTGEGLLSFTLHRYDERVEVLLHTAGLHNVENGLAAAAIATAVGADLSVIAAGLADFRPPDKRQQVIAAPTGALLINDTYNANPASMAAGLRTLVAFDRPQHTAIIGDMLELGDSSESAHHNIGKLAAELHINCLVTMGQFSAAVGQGARDGGMADSQIHVFAEKSAGEAWLKMQVTEKRFGQDDVILVKASRGRRFETIIDIIMSSANSGTKS